MSNKLTSVAQLRQAGLACQGMVVDVAGAAADAIGEVAAGLPVRRSVTLAASGWTGSAAPYTQTVSVEGVLTDETKQLIQPVPSNASRTAYYDAGIQCVTQAENALTFTATKIPESDIPMFVILQALGDEQGV